MNPTVAHVVNQVFIDWSRAHGFMSEATRFAVTPEQFADLQKRTAVAITAMLDLSYVGTRL